MGSHEQISPLVFGKVWLHPFFPRLYICRTTSPGRNDQFNTEGAILKQNILRGIANQLTQATVSRACMAVVYEVGSFIP